MRVLLLPVAVGLPAVVVVRALGVGAAQPGGHPHLGQALGGVGRGGPGPVPVAVAAQLAGHLHGAVGPGGDGGEAGQLRLGHALGVGVAVAVGAHGVDGVAVGRVGVAVVLVLDVLDQLVQPGVGLEGPPGLGQGVQVPHHVAGVAPLGRLLELLSGGEALVVLAARALDERLEHLGVAAVQAHHELTLGAARGAVVVGHDPVGLELVGFFLAQPALLFHAQVAAEEEGGCLAAGGLLHHPHGHGLLVVVADALAGGVLLGPHRLQGETLAEIKFLAGHGRLVDGPVGGGLALAGVLAQVGQMAHGRDGDAVFGPGADDLAHREVVADVLHPADVVHVAVRDDHGVQLLDSDTLEGAHQAVAGKVPASIHQDVLAAEGLHQRGRALAHVDVMNLVLLGGAGRSLNRYGDQQAQAESGDGYQRKMRPFHIQAPRKDWLMGSGLL